MKFSHYLHTAASVKLPLMSVVKVINKRTGKSVSVLINDRGPHKTNAIIDLSKASAEALNYRASDQVIVEFDIERTLELASNSSEIAQFIQKL
jgi:rare lipoprotein A